MMSKNENNKEMERLIRKAKKGHEESVVIIIESFQGLIKNNYNNRIQGKHNICIDDYIQECNVKIIKCIKKVTKNNYWQLCRLIKVGLKNSTIDFIEKHQNFTNNNRLFDDIEEVYDNSNLSSEYKFDDLIISDMIAKDSYNNFIKDKLSKEEDNVFSLHIFGQSLSKYAEEKGVKVESVKRTLRRAVKKIENKQQIRDFHYMGIIAFITIKDIGGRVKCLNIVDLMDLLQRVMI